MHKGTKTLTQTLARRCPLQLIETELARKITNRAPALAPVPQRQPIGDSFFPQVPQAGEGEGEGEGAAQAAVVTKDEKRKGEEEEEEDKEALEPVDIVSRLWTF